MNAADSHLMGVIGSLASFITTDATSSQITSSSFVESYLDQTTASSTVASDTILSGNSFVGSSTLLHHLRGVGVRAYNNFVTAGDFSLPDGSVYRVDEKRLLTDVENDDPVAEITPYVSHEYTVAFVSSTTDIDLLSDVFQDKWTEVFDFGDGSPIVTATTTRLDTQFIHRYSTYGSYLIQYTVCDLFGSVSTYSRVYELPDPYAYITQRGTGGGNPPAPLSQPFVSPVEASPLPTPKSSEIAPVETQGPTIEKPLLEMVKKETKTSPQVSKVKKGAKSKTKVVKTRSSDSLPRYITDKALTQEPAVSTRSPDKYFLEKIFSGKVKEFLTSLLP